MRKKKCCICGSIADSGEHRMKNTDLKAISSQKDELCLLRDNKLIPLQSTNSKFIKAVVLCKNCNNHKTQPFDKAYEEFIKYINKNKKEIIHKRFINLSNVFEKNMEQEQTNLYKYLVKSFVCRLAYFNHPIPQDLIDLLDKDSFQSGLRITFAINEIILNNKYGLEECVGNGTIGANQSYLDGTSDILFYTYFEQFKWLDIYYYYYQYDNYQTDGNLGSTWIANNQFIYLGTSYNDLVIKDLQKYHLFKIKWSSIPFQDVMHT